MKNENVDGYRFVNKAKKDREQLELSRVLMKLGSSSSMMMMMIYFLSKDFSVYDYL